MMAWKSWREVPALAEILYFSRSAARTSWLSSIRRNQLTWSEGWRNVASKSGRVPQGHRDDPHPDSLDAGFAQTGGDEVTSVSRDQLQRCCAQDFILLFANIRLGLPVGCLPKFLAHPFGYLLHHGTFSLGTGLRSGTAILHSAVRRPRSIPMADYVLLGFCQLLVELQFKCSAARTS